MFFITVFEGETHMDEALWKVSEFDILCGHCCGGDSLPLLNFDHVEAILKQCGSSITTFCLHLQTRSHYSVKFNDDLHWLGKAVDYLTILDLVPKFCHNLETLYIQTANSHIDISEKIYKIMKANEQLKSLNICCEAQSSVKDIVQVKNVPERIRKLKINLVLKDYDLQDNTICCVSFIYCRVDLHHYFIKKFL